MDDIDRKAISLLMDATLMSEDEIERTLKILRNMARIKKRKEKNLKSGVPPAQQGMNPILLLFSLKIWAFLFQFLPQIFLIVFLILLQGVFIKKIKYKKFPCPFSIAIFKTEPGNTQDILK